MTRMSENLKSVSDEHYSPTGLSEPASRARQSGPAPTPREIEIIQLLTEGKANRQIASELGISVRTVEAHRARVMRKLHVRSLVELVYYAIDTGIAPPH